MKDKELIVKKFGGTSLANIDRIKAAADIIAKTKNSNTQVIVVVSAMSQATNKLTNLGLEIGGKIESREMEVLLTSGEQVTMALLAMALQNKGIAAQSLLAWQTKINTDGRFAQAKIKSIDSDNILKLLNEDKVVIIPGFQGIDAQNNINTLGRGGSDTTAVALAVSLKASECQIYTDVMGVYTADPRVCNTARKLEFLTYEEMMELASDGSKVLHTRSVLFAAKSKIPLRVLSSFEAGLGTLIGTEKNLIKIMEAPLITGIAHNINEAKVSILGVEDKPGIASEILDLVASSGINVDIILQNVGKDGKNDLTITIPKDKVELAQQILASVDCEHIEINDKIAKISVVGYGMKSHTGVASILFATLAKANINIEMITTSEIKITVIVDEKYVELAVRALHDSYDLQQV